jgi:hypothetical protein
VADEEKAAMSVNVSCVTRSCHRKRAKESIFWERIATHYNNNRCLCCAKHLAKSLETKWGAIHMLWQNFVTIIKQWLLSTKSGESSEHTLQKALKLFKAKHPKQGSFVKIHFWSIL